MKSLNVLAGIMVAAGSGGVLGQYPSPPAPTQPNTVANCLTWHVVSAGDTCLTIETAFGITHTDFLAWNPNVNSECTVNFWGAYAYCVGAPPAPIHPGTATNCNAWHVVAAGETCASVETTAAITHAQFMAWNPAVNEACTTNFWGTYAYCVGVRATPPSTASTVSTTSSTSTTTTSTSVTSPPGPTFTGTPSNCTEWHTVQTGDTCVTIEATYGITRAEFLAWNPAVNGDCTANFWAEYSYCVGLDTASTPTPPTTTTKTTTTTSSTNTMPYSIRYPVTSEIILQPTTDTAWPPTKTQPGQPTYCNNWHLVLPGQTCDTIAVLYDTWMGLANL